MGRCLLHSDLFQIFRWLVTGLFSLHSVSSSPSGKHSYCIFIYRRRLCALLSSVCTFSSLFFRSTLPQSPVALRCHRSRVAEFFPPFFSTLYTSDYRPLINSLLWAMLTLRWFNLQMKWILRIVDFLFRGKFISTRSTSCLRPRLYLTPVLLYSRVGWTTLFSSLRLGLWYSFSSKGRLYSSTIEKVV